MAMLSFIRGRPIGFIDGGEHDQKILRIVTQDEKEVKKSNPVLLLGQDYFLRLRKKDKSKINKDEMAQIIEGLMTMELPEDEALHEPYTEALERFTEIDKAEIALKNGVVRPIPNLELEEKAQRENYFLAGPSGSGKSYLSRDICDRYRDDDPDKPIFMFSRVTSDPAFEDLKMTRKVINDDLVKEEQDISEFKNAIVIFDDIDTIKNKKHLAHVMAVRDDVLETGRHENITVITTSHLLLNYNKTKSSLNEATNVVFYPQSGSIVQIKRYLKEHAGLEPKAARKVLALPSRWVMHCKTAPQCFVHEKGALTHKGLA
jgi:chromosomal replication initiation ATPase DnaA